jgi:Domain of unknown function (DUF4328)
VARWSIGAHALALFAGGIASVMLATGDGSWRLDPAGMTTGGAWAAGPLIAPVRVLLGVQAATLVVAMVAWLTWQALATENAWAVRAPIQVTPGWAVLWWFIPFANMGKPAGSISQLLRSAASVAGIRAHDNPLVVVWWAGFLSGQVLAFIGILVLIGEGISVATASFDVVRPSDIDEGLWITAAGMLLQAASAAPAIAIIRRVDDRQAVHEETVVPGTPSLAAPPRPDMA